VEREILLTGIGGQGIQLMARILAQAAADEGREVMLFGMYMGMMRGGASDATVVIADESISAPPIVPDAWAGIAMHPLGLPGLLARLRPGGILFCNATLVAAPAERGDLEVFAVPASRIAEAEGAAMGAGMVVLGAFAAATGIVGERALVAAMRESLPPHRQPYAEANARWLAAGAAYAARHLGGSRSAARLAGEV
jgi:Pyruvate/2-oxoacid:ferredoxin oxidoreductase gamma subunit